jgi:hypothetical protein
MWAREPRFPRKLLGQGKQKAAGLERRLKQLVRASLNAAAANSARNRGNQEERNCDEEDDLGDADSRAGHAAKA